LAEIPVQTVVFVNRLSDYLFVWSRMVSLREGVDETLWISNP
jgi:cob(I)alamin adenosyltransferase